MASPPSGSGTRSSAAWRIAGSRPGRGRWPRRGSARRVDGRGEGRRPIAFIAGKVGSRPSVRHRAGFVETAFRDHREKSRVDAAVEFGTIGHQDDPLGAFRGRPAASTARRASRGGAGRSPPAPRARGGFVTGRSSAGARPPDGDSVGELGVEVRGRPAIGPTNHDGANLRRDHRGFGEAFRERTEIEAGAADDDRAEPGSFGLIKGVQRRRPASCRRSSVPPPGHGRTGGAGCRLPQGRSAEPSGREARHKPAAHRR